MVPLPTLEIFSLWSTTAITIIVGIEQIEIKVYCMCSNYYTLCGVRGLRINEFDCAVKRKVIDMK